MKMKKLFKCLMVACLLTTFLGGCSSTSDDEEIVEEEIVEEVVEEEPVVNVAPEGTYFSELTGEPIDESLYGQRPIAVMIDNEKAALPHYGIAECDVVYEMVNSTKNNRITRLFGILKDWGSITQMGSIRSTRATNIILSAEWNSVLCHDGGAAYLTSTYYKRAYATERFNALFSRVSNGKSYEFTEYILEGDIEDAFAKKGYSTTYNDYAPEYPDGRETHFNYVDYIEGEDNQTSLENYDDTFDAVSVSLPFYHNKSKLYYNEETGTYDYYEYGSIHLDAEDDEVLTFKNVFIQCASITVEEAKEGYLVYNLVGDWEGYYLTNGKAIKVTCSKESETAITRYFDSEGNEIEINRGKTYIALVIDDSWDEVEFNIE